MAVLVALVVALAGCTGGGSDSSAGRSTTDTMATTTSAARADGPVTIVVLGSSTAAGFGLDRPELGWVVRYGAAIAEARPGSEVVNLAVPGFSTFQVQADETSPPDGRPAPDPAHNITAALALDPDAVIVNLPSNDTMLGIEPAEQLANLQAVVAEADADGVPVWVTTTQPRAFDADGRRIQVEVRDLILGAFGDRAIDVWTDLATDGGVLAEGLDLGDGIHLTAAGHEQLLRLVQEAGIVDVVAGS